MDASQRREFQKGMRKSTGSYELVLSPAILALLGLWLDRTVSTQPLFTILAVVLGFTGASIKLYYQYSAEMAQQEVGKPWAKQS